MILYSSKVDDKLMNACNIYCFMFHWFLMLFAILNMDTRILNSTEFVFFPHNIVAIVKFIDGLKYNRSMFVLHAIVMCRNQISYFFTFR